MEYFAIGISLFALLFSLFTYFKHDKKIKEQSSLLNEYNLKKIAKEQVEEKKAIIEANVLPYKQGIRKIKIYNKGKSTARKVNVKIPEEIGFQIFSNPCPIDIRPQNGIEITLGQISEGDPNKVEFEFEWSDDYKEKNIDRQIVQI